jgi:hypothetical protein
MKMAKAKKEVKKPAPAKVELTEAVLKVIRSEAAVVDYSLVKIRTALKCTWKNAVELRQAALKADKK